MNTALLQPPVSVSALESERSPAGLRTLLELARSAKADGRIHDGLTAALQAWELLGPEERGTGPAPCGELAAEVGCLVVHFSLRAGHFTQALDFGRRVLQVLTRPEQVLQRTEVLRFLVGASLELADFENALSLAMECSELADRHLGVSEQSRACAALAGCYGSLGDHEHAERLTLEALALAEQGPEGLPRLATLNNLCAISINAYFQQREAGDPQGAQAALERSLSYARRLHDGLALMEHPEAALCAFATGNLGEVLLHLGQDTEAEQALNDTLQTTETLGLLSIAWRMRYLLAEVHIKKGQFEPAKVLLAQVLQAGANVVGSSTMERTHLAMHRCCKGMGLLHEALEHLEVGRRMGMQRTRAQLAVQSRLFVTRLEADRSRQMAERAESEARRQGELAQAYSEAAITDALTGLHNRRHLESRVPAVLIAARDAGRPMSLAMLDLDHFKSVNDRFGHSVGDQVLVRLARILRERMRAEDHLVRMGGEEILVILSGASPALAMEICERLREAVSVHPWNELHPDLQVSVSMGLACSPEYDLNTLIERADAALYQAKHAGRNRVCAAPSA
jgi:diguanylate cyclase (GGDEF)-like protein